ncbi:MAG: hypothetical protein CMO80_09330 [Verrucomicrobiales bacterium]|nr:hypothetical protein [Verrucomicrobiales bacterium]|tara:strand:+ start:2194 stop:3684 length:1491 start_codon:yes stop_codon:yes gene_type:complete
MTMASLSKEKLLWPQRLRMGVAIVTAILATLSLPLENGIAGAFSWVVLAGIFLLLWRPGEAPALPFALTIQWLQASIAVHYCNFYGVRLEQFIVGVYAEDAVLLSLMGLLVVTLGIRLALGRANPEIAKRIRTQSEEISLHRMFVIWAGATVASIILTMLALRAGGLRQFILPFASLNMIALGMLAYKVVSGGRGYLLLGIATLVEVGVQLMGFFAGFKLVFFVLIMAIPAAFRRLRIRNLITVSVCGVGLVFLLLVYSAVKYDHREVLRGGDKTIQSIAVSRSEQFSSLWQLVSGLTLSDLDLAVTTMVERVNYVLYFAHVQEMVPSSIPHEQGRIWMETLMFVAMPRVLFPNKPATNDSKKTNRYLPYKVAGLDQGTTITIGYMGESFIDFGRVGMMVPLFALGIFAGSAYRLMAYSRYPFLGLGLVIAIHGLGFHLLEASTKIIVGGLFIRTVILGGASVVLSSRVWRWMSKARPTVQPAFAASISRMHRPQP